MTHQPAEPKASSPGSFAMSKPVQYPFAFLGALIGVSIGWVDGVKAIGPGDFSEFRMALTLMFAIIGYGATGALGLPVLVRLLSPTRVLGRLKLEAPRVEGRHWLSLGAIASGTIIASWGTWHMVQTIHPGLNPKTLVAAVLMVQGAGTLIVLRLMGRIPPPVRDRLSFGAIGVTVVVLTGVALLENPYQPLYSRQQCPPRVLDKPGRDRPNILLVVLDTTRADHLTPYGYARDTTPFLAELARESTLYENAIAPSPWTLPSHASMFTGQPPSAHGAIHQHRWLSDDFVTMAELLHAQGYDTVGLSSNSWLGRSFNTSRGFEHFYEIYKRISLYDRDPLEALAVGGLAVSLVGTRIPEDKGAEAIDHLAPAWLDQWQNSGTDRPFFMFINYLEPHLPYCPPRQFRDRFVTRPVRPRLQFLLEPDWWYRDKTFQLLSRMDALEPADHAQLTALYDAGLAYVDTRVQQLVTSLRDRNLLEHTVLIVTSDHGENLGEHGGLVSHTFSLHQSVLHVPLIVRYPDQFEQGLRHRGLVSTLAVFPTILELAGVAPAQAWPPAVEALPRHPTDPGMAFAVSEEDLPVDELSRLVTARPGTDVRPLAVEQACIQTRDWKLIERSDGQRILFDLRADPNELTPLEPSESESGQLLHQALLQWKDEHPLYETRTHEPSDIDKASLKALKALGYVK